MASLFDLPNELTLTVAESIGPQDSFNLAITCRRFSDLLGPLIKNHKELFDKYQRIDGDQCGENYMWDLTCEIIKNPQIADYVRTLDLKYWHKPNYGDSIISPGMRLPQEQADLISSAVEKSPYLTWKRPSTEEITRQIENGSLGAVMAVLLTLLPGLEFLHYTNYDTEKWILEVVQGVIRARNGPSPPTALQNLRRLDISHWDTEYGVDLEIADHFAALPNVRKIAGLAIAEEDEWEDPEGPQGSDDLSYAARLGWPRSHLECVHFDHSCIHHTALERFLSNIDGLKEFHYIHGGATVGFCAFYYREFVKHLTTYAKHSLEVLFLESEEELEFLDEECIPAPPTFASFEKLKELGCDFGVFGPVDDDSLVAEDVDEALSEGFYTEDNLAKPPSTDLVSMLPSSLARLTLFRVPENELESVLRLVQSKSQFPTLESITVNRDYDYREIPADIKTGIMDAAKKNGIKVILK